MKQMDTSAASRRRAGRRGTFWLVPLIFALVFGIFGRSAMAQDAMLRDFAFGRPDAPLTIVEFASMTCPHCAAFHEQVLPKLKSAYIDTGKVQLIYRDFPLDGDALRAAMIARCAGTGRYAGFVEMIYQQQKNWAGAQEPLQALERLAQLGGLSSEAFKACLANKEVETYVLNSRMSGRREFNISGTPSFFINGRTYTGIASFDELKGIIDPLLARRSGN